MTLNPLTPPMPGVSVQPMSSWGDRPYELHVPKGYDGKSPLPVVVALHGSETDGEILRQWTSPDRDPANPGSMDSVADREGFAVVYPNGNGHEEPGYGNGRVWNAGGGNGYTPIVPAAWCDNSDDVKYVSDVLDDVARHVHVDTKREYVVGFSNGGVEANRIGMALGNRLAAIGAVSANNEFAAGDPSARPVAQLPVIMINGTHEVPYGIPYAKSELGSLGGGLVQGAREALDGWITWNGAAKLATDVALPDLDPSDQTSVSYEHHAGLTSRGDVDMFSVHGGGHRWPGGAAQYSHRGGAVEAKFGAVNRDINASQALWDFFKAHPRD